MQINIFEIVTFAIRKVRGGLENNNGWPDLDEDLGGW